ncbi:MAG TPA: carboxypeptidase-like regulatory domain-containing protein [Pyrinomonadaceae bacterium]|nr:carboxypeptidase-like regulatory domain-containing protein [Pyrinomonadaceae bacterium]
MNLKSLRLIYVFVALLCFAGSVLVPTQAQQPEPAQNTGSISGRVTVDGKSKAGLVVELLTTDTIGPRRLVARVTTNKLGKYVLTNVNSGSYDVSPSSQTLVVPNQSKSGQSGKSISLEAGECIKGIDFDLVSQGIIRGRVRNIAGEPVRGQTVELIPRGGDNSYSPPFHSSVPGEQSTNDDGIYRISGVPPGRYIVKVGVAYGLTAYGSSEAGQLYYPETFHPDADEASKATVVEVVRGRETTDVDITVGSPLKVYEIVGQLILVETGAPVPNVALEITTTSKTTKTSIHGAWSSDATGAFRIQNALPGHYVVAPDNDRVSNTYGDPISFDVRDADVTALKIPMHSASTLSGIVTVEGYVDIPVADLFSKLIISALTWSDNLTASTMSSPISADGGFQIAGIRPGKVHLDSYVPPGGPEGFSLIRIERNGVEVPDGIEVRAGEDIKGLRLILGAGNSVLRGDVKIEGGPLEGVNLHVMYRPTNGDPNRFFRAELDARRHFVIKGLMPGEYELMIGPMSLEVSGERGSQTMNRMPTVKQSVMVGPGADAEVILVMTLKPAPPAPPQR